MENEAACEGDRSIGAVWHATQVQTALCRRSGQECTALEQPPAGTVRDRERLRVWVFTAGASGPCVGACDESRRARPAGIIAGRARSKAQCPEAELACKSVGVRRKSLWLKGKKQRPLVNQEERHLIP